MDKISKPIPLFIIVLITHLFLVFTRLVASPFGFLIFCVTIFLLLFSCTYQILILSFQKKIKQSFFGLFLFLMVCFYVLSCIAYREQLIGINLFYIPSESMTPALNNGDFIIADTFAYKTKQPNKGDVVVFKYPKTNTTMVKRISEVREYFVTAIGDNKSKSIQTRNLRNIPINNIRGKVRFILYNKNSSALLKKVY